MNSTSFSFYSNVFGFVAGGISLLGCLVGLCHPHLPSNKIKTLETLLHETENIFQGAVEDGLLVAEFVHTTETRLALLSEETCGLRSRAYNATSLLLDYAEFLRGTSSAIGSTCQSLKKLRAEVITSSEENRRRLTQMNPIPEPPPAILSHTEPEHPSTPSSLEIIRPHSCPPAVCTWGSCDVPNVNIQSGLSWLIDYQQGGSDVQTVDIRT